MTFDHVTQSNDSVNEEEEELLPDFLMSAMSYTQLILLNKNSPKSSFLLLDTVLKPLLAVISGLVFYCTSVGLHFFYCGGYT